MSSVSEVVVVEDVLVVGAPSSMDDIVSIVVNFMFRMEVVRVTTSTGVSISRIVVRLQTAINVNRRSF